ncbi:NAD(P)H-dependent oxidoreductase [Grimontia kaedaensis]|uniref:NAD(P)H-dependent oxidoreductase n=1 Tax=Grimontia kaedaensis TaxID=2872157 RepID=A0ABY4X1X1_9GAMM|nr:NAD(P)H-dependent oxidoreductase [Grimontia kaedaensis]USH05249.1 NAD(P)H-dependent oxidoreductase [Grimontia kaedaensis]
MNILVINGHHYYPFSEGNLNKAMVDVASKTLTAQGYSVRLSSCEDYEVNEEIENHQWADVVILQSPVNWMGVSWKMKKYMDEVYTAGMGGELCAGDGRHRDTDDQYGTGGTLRGKKYMLSLTYNAPKEAFDDESQWLLRGKGIDDMFLPIHLNFRFFGMEALDTFACFDVMKNPNTENDKIRFKAHLESQLGG